MIKFKKWLSSVHRVKNLRINHDIEALRLDKSERALFANKCHEYLILIWIQN